MLCVYPSIFTTLFDVAVFPSAQICIRFVCILYIWCLSHLKTMVVLKSSNINFTSCAYQCDMALMLSQCFACFLFRILAFDSDKSITNQIEMQTNLHTLTTSTLPKVKVIGNDGNIEWHHLLFVWCLVYI